MISMLAKILTCMFHNDHIFLLVFVSAGFIWLCYKFYDEHTGGSTVLPEKR